MSRFSGICYDGPKEGMMIAHDGPYYRIPIYPHRVRAPDYFAEGQANISYRVGTYVWSYPMRKWVWRYDA